MRIQYILHADFELPGAIGTWAKQKHFDEKTCRPYAGEKIPQASDFDLLILMGGPQCLLKMDEAPYLKGELSLIKQTIKAGIPVLGFCLGAQLIGEALGARTEKSPNKEIGIFPIKLTAEGKADPLLKGLPGQFPVVHWHNDMPGMTTEASILAESEGCPRQIVRYLPIVYGFQCHPEPTKQNIEAMIAHCASDLVPGKYVQPKEALLSGDYRPINQIMMQILDNVMSMMSLTNSLNL